MFGAVIAVSRLHARICPKCDNFAIRGTFKGYPLRGFENFNISQFSQVTRSFSNWKSGVFNKSSWRTYVVGWNQISQQILSRSSILKRFQSSAAPKPKAYPFRITKSTVNPLKINTNVKNNVMLYRYEKDSLMAGAVIFGIAAMIGCIFMADSVYLVLCKDLFNDAIPLKERLLDHAFPITAIVLGLLAGPAIMAGIWFLVVRSVKYVILLKGGKMVTIVTYHPVKRYVKMTLPVEDVNCQTAREEIKSYVMIKIKNRKYQYIMDKSGQFVNPELFDSTVGVSRET